jgi:hypothetical protein
MQDADGVDAVADRGPRIVNDARHSGELLAIIRRARPGAAAARLHARRSRHRRQPRPAVDALVHHPWIPHDDAITPQDIQGVRGFGMSDAADPLATVMERKLTRMRVKHAQTREYMEINALRGIVKDGAGVTLYDYFSEFGLTQQSVDFVLGTAGTQVQAKVREVLRKIETELKGETMSGVLALVSPEFFDKLIGHAKVEDAYKYFSSTGAQPLREDTRRRFPFAGILFEEYSATVTLSIGATETLVPAGEGEFSARLFERPPVT